MNSKYNDRLNEPNINMIIPDIKYPTNELKLYSPFCKKINSRIIYSIINCSNVICLMI